MKCKNFQYEVGKTFETDEAVRCTDKGFHSCEHPLDVFKYYPPGTSRFAECEASGKIDKGTGDSKLASSKLKIKGEINLAEIIKVGIEKILSKVNFKDAASNSGYCGAASNSGDCGAAINSGYCGAASNSGDYGAAINSGYRGAAINSGEESITCGLGKDNKAMGSLGTWIVLAERDVDFKIKWVKTAKVDGKKIEADTWYKLKNGKFVQAK